MCWLRLRMILKMIKKPNRRLYFVLLIVALTASIMFLFDIHIYSDDEDNEVQARKNIFESNCIIIGGMSFIGSRLAATDLNCTNIVPIEDSINIQPDVMRWYRWTQLTTELKLSTTFVDFSRDESKLIQIIESSNHNFIYYVPTGMMRKELKLIDRVELLQITSQTVANFNKLLNILTTHSSSIKQFTLMSFSEDKDRTWLSPLEQSLLSFHHKFSIDTVIIKGFTKGLYGPWQEQELGTYCWYVDDIISQLLLLISSRKSNNNLIIHDYSSKCQVNGQRDKIYKTQLWYNQYKASVKNQTKNVVAGAILNLKSKHASWGGPVFFFPKAEEYIAKFVYTASRYSHIDILIIHNHLSMKFVQYYEKICPKCKLARYSRVNDRIAIDQRFYMIYDYLLRHPEIKSLINADVKDVVFTGDPFQVMNTIGDMFYAGIDFPFYTTVDSFPWISRMFRKCYPNYEHSQEVLNLFGVFNSGVTGGSRHVMLSFLAKEILYLDTSRKEGVCDMTTAQITYHIDYYNQVYAGYPFVGSYYLGMPGPDGSAIKHKYTDIAKLRKLRT